MISSTSPRGSPNLNNSTKWEKSLRFNSVDSSPLSSIRPQYSNFQGRASPRISKLNLDLNEEAFVQKIPIIEETNSSVQVQKIKL